MGESHKASRKQAATTYVKQEWTEAVGMEKGDVVNSAGSKAAAVLGGICSRCTTKVTACPQ